MRHMLQPNFSLVLPRRVETAIPWSHVFVSDAVTEHVAVSLKTIDYCFPLYLYPDINKRDLFTPHEPNKRIPNIALWLSEALAKAYKKQIMPETIFAYIYAILYSNAYREKYAEFLRVDFPRIPFTKNIKIFQKLADIGEELMAIHLMKSKILDKPIARCEGSGGLLVEKPTYDEKSKRININPGKYFEPANGKYGSTN